MLLWLVWPLVPEKCCVFRLRIVFTVHVHLLTCTGLYQTLAGLALTVGHFVPLVMNETTAQAESRLVTLFNLTPP